MPYLYIFPDSNASCYTPLVTQVSLDNMAGIGSFVSSQIGSRSQFLDIKEGHFSAQKRTKVFNIILSPRARILQIATVRYCLQRLYTKPAAYFH